MLYGELLIFKIFEGYLCDVWKEFLMFGYCGGCKIVNIGCGIGILLVKLMGLVGFFVRLVDFIGILRSGFFIVVYVVIENYDELYEYSLLFFKYFFVRECYKIIYLLYVDSSVNNIIGEVIELFFGNYGLNGIGIDVVFV